MKRKVILFLVLSFGSDWSVWLITASQYGPIVDGNGDWGIIATLSMFGPMVSVLIVRLLPGEDVERGWRSRIRKSVRAYLMAWLAPAVLMFAGTVVKTASTMATALAAQFAILCLR